MKRSRALRWVALACAVLIPATSALPAAAFEVKPLAPVEADVRARFPSVGQLTTADAEALLAKPEGVMIIDARSPAEYAVSHLPGAVNVDPSTSASTFQSTYGQSLKDKTVVVYCSVGMRSSTLAGTIGAAAKSSGASAVYNLQGGVFRWHNERRPLVNASGPTDEVNPYSSNAKLFLERQDKAVYKPGDSAK
jgi:rhodanese-related sulfurtransferase